MTADETMGPDELDETIVLRRRDPAPAEARVGVESEPEGEPETDETVVVRREVHEAPLEESLELDETVVVSRAVDAAVDVRPDLDAQPEDAQPEVDETVVVRRDVGEAPQDGDDDADDADELDETIVVGRIVSPAEPVAPPLTPRLAFAPVTPPAPATEAPAPENEPVPEPEPEPGPAPEPEPRSEPIDALESTRVVQHEDEPDDSLLATRVVHHGADDGPEAPAAVGPGLDDDADDTRVVRRRDRRENPDTPASDPLPDDGDTLIRERPVLTDGPEAPFAPASGGGRRGGQLPTTRRALRAQRTPVVLPAGLPPSARAAEAPGVDAVESYRPRPIPAPPEPGPELPTGPEATRAEAPSMHSVSRASRRAGWGAVAAIAGACVVSVVGLVVVALTVFAG